MKNSARGSARPGRLAHLPLAADAAQVEHERMLVVVHGLRHTLSRRDMCE
jgi:hypothetical protein